MSSETPGIDIDGKDRVSSISDNELMLQVRDGQVAKLGTLYERHCAKLLNFFTKHTNRRDVSEDLVQDVFFRMMKYRQTYRGEAPFAVWMYRLARNVSADYFRKWKEQSMGEDQPERQDPDPLASDVLEQTEEHQFLKEALSNLSHEKREVLLMSRFQELKYEDIGQILDCPVGTVKARVHFALKDLRKEYVKLTEKRT